jgi:hypothetical protein
MTVGRKSFASGKLKALAQDEDHKPYVRGKQSPANLPNSWDTKWIKREKSWKSHKLRKQWSKIK